MVVTAVPSLDDFSNEARRPMLNRVVEGSVDFKGRPALQSKSGSWRSAYYILGAEMLERVAFLGIRSNLVSYLTGPMGQSTAMAVVNVNVWTRVADLSPFLGVFVGDAVLGRYWVIVVASLFFALGYTGLVYTLLELTNLMMMIIIHKERKAKASFFNWWTFSLSAGALITFSVLSYIQDNLSWLLGYGVQLAAMLLSMLLSLVFFSLGTGSYRFPAACSRNERNLFSTTGSIIVKAVRSWRRYIFPNNSASTEDAQEIMPSGDHIQSKFFGNALLSPNGSNHDEEACSTTSPEIGNTKPILKLLPLWSTCLGFAIIYSQTATVFIKQGATMERYITSKFQVPAASLQSVLTITMLILLPLYDLAFIPIARVIRKNSTLGITVLQRGGTGLFLSTIAMSVAAVVKQNRLAVALAHGLVDRPNETVPMSIWWLVPQYLILGSAFCFSLPGLQEFFYDQVPAKMKSVGLALYLSVFGIGNLLSSFLVSITDKATTGGCKDSWFSDNLNRAHLDYFYWLLAGIGLVEFVAYVYFAKSYVYTKKILLGKKTS